MICSLLIPGLLTNSSSWQLYNIILVHGCPRTSAIHVTAWWRRVCLPVKVRTVLNWHLDLHRLGINWPPSISLKSSDLSPVELLLEALLKFCIASLRERWRFRTLRLGFCIYLFIFLGGIKQGHNQDSMLYYTTESNRILSLALPSFKLQLLSWKLALASQQ